MTSVWDKDNTLTKYLLEETIHYDAKIRWTTPLSACWLAETNLQELGSMGFSLCGLLETRFTPGIYRCLQVEDGQWQPKSQYHVKAGVRGLNWKNQRPETMTDFRNILIRLNKPFVSHETGQWCVFPNFNEIEIPESTKARQFRNLPAPSAHARHGRQRQDFMMASENYRQLRYKHEIEQNSLRTPDYAGFQLLLWMTIPTRHGTSRYSGCVLWRKRLLNADEWRRFVHHRYPLWRTEKVR